MMFLLLVNESLLSQTIYTEYMWAPFTWLDTIFFDPLPIKLRPFDLILLVVLIASGLKRPIASPMRTAMYTAMGTTVLWFLIGVTRGGDSRAGSWQIYLLLAAPMAGFAVAATHTKTAHFRTMAKYIVAAGLYRAMMCLIFYFGYARSMEIVPAHMTTHADTVLWVVSLGIIIAAFLEMNSRSVKLLAYLGGPLILAAIHFNNRRLAWVSFVTSLVALYFLVPPSKMKKRLRKVALACVPLLGVYVVVGWGRPERIFKPLASLSSVSSKPDPSTLARNVENLSLIATASYSPLTGSGWGHKYVELSSKYTIAGAMELWQYVPHNSVLGLFGFTGYLGVLGFWMIFPTAIFLLARTAYAAQDTRTRSVGIVGVMATITVLNQMFGDMGIFSWTNMYMLAMVMGAALRVPAESGAWPGRIAAAPPQPAATQPEMAPVHPEAGPVVPG
jgi:hypothetical protein